MIEAAPILWMRFPEESIGHQAFDTAAQARLNAVFDCDDAASPFRQALTLIGLRTPPVKTRMIAWRNNVPFINGSAMTAVVSGGTMYLARQGAGYKYAMTKDLPALWRLTQAQWRMARFMAQRAEYTTPSIALSLALGIVLQGLVLRSGANEAALARDLAQPAQAPASRRAILRQMQDIQERRTVLSPVWQDVLPTSAVAAPADTPSA